MLNKKYMKILATICASSSLCFPIIGASANSHHTHFPVIRVTRNRYKLRLHHHTIWVHKNYFNRNEQAYISLQLNHRNRRHHHKSHQRRYNRISRKRHYNYVSHNKSLRSLSRMQNGVAQSVRDWSIKYVNHYRISHHLNPLKITYGAQMLADKRLPQVVKTHSHYNRKGQPMIHVDSRRYHLNRYGATNFGENIGNGYNNKNPHVTRPTGYDNPPYRTYVVRENGGRGISRGLHKAFMFHDQSDHNAHRKNILDPNTIGLGVSANYNQKTGESNLTEEFQDPNV